MTAVPKPATAHGFDVGGGPSPPERASLARASQLVLGSVDRLFNRSLSGVMSLVRVGHLQLVSPESAARIRQALVDPVREIADRGGKGWRSSAMLVACEAVGGDPAPLKDDLGVIELLHVGSLIVDDVQDEAPVRRGGPSCHAQVGVPLAINAGTSAYFLFDRLVTGLPLSAAGKLRLYQLFFECMRAAHAGQALDLAGVQPQARHAAHSGDVAPLLDAICTIHAHKTGVPVVLCLLTGATVGKARHVVIDAMAQYGIAMGLAFQIGDDVLNLRGFQQALKQSGEDLAGGKVTYPVALALERLPSEQRHELLARIERRDGSPDNLRRVVALLDSVDACERSLAAGEDALDRAWAGLDPHLPESPAKRQLRSYGSLFLRRHY
ncbi:MAG TPA: polyprenyl synthetase family protein [Polyangiaceae bacterium]|nr:polyprenyl synthetase family protein [Polyangiaceae bacterium]